jgi:hypothetical protein
VLYSKKPKDIKKKYHSSRGSSGEPEDCLFCVKFSSSQVNSGISGSVSFRSSISWIICGKNSSSCFLCTWMI